MSMQPAPWPDPDPQVAAATAAKCRGERPRPLAVVIRDRLGEWLADEDFAAAFGIRGKPGWSPSRLALVTVLQRAEKLTGRMAADAVRMRIGWKYLVGLPIDDPGFDDSVLPEFRGKVADAGLEQVALDALLTRLAGSGLAAAGGSGRQAARRFHPRGRGGGGAEPAGTGRGKRAGRAGGADRRAPGGGGAAIRRPRFPPPLRHPGDLLAAPAIA